jgi:hypothetical protein
MPFVQAELLIERGTVAETALTGLRNFRCCSGLLLVAAGITDVGSAGLPPEMRATVNPLGHANLKLKAGSKARLRGEDESWLRLESRSQLCLAPKALFC